MGDDGGVQPVAGLKPPMPLRSIKFVASVINELINRNGRVNQLISQMRSVDYT